MDGKTRQVEAFVNQSGSFRDLKGAETPVTFSLYMDQEFIQGIPREQSAEGFCRVSDGSNVLEALFIAGSSVVLSCREFETTVYLTSPCTFEVTGTVVRKNGFTARSPWDFNNRPTYIQL